MWKIIMSQPQSFFFPLTKLFFQFHYEFREHSGAKNAKTELIYEIWSNIDRSKIATTLFLDLTKVFDNTYMSSS